MLNKKGISIFVSTFLIVGLLFVALPETGFSQDGCCQVINNETGAFACGNTMGICATTPEFSIIGFFEGENCIEQTGLCTGFVPPIESTNVPTLSEWGLIAMAGILGIVGFMVMRRRKVTA